MSEALVVGILGAVATVVAALLTAYRDELFNVFARGQRRFDGRWIGTSTVFQAFDSSDPFVTTSYEMTAEVKQSGRRLKGVATVSRAEGETYREVFSGEVMNDTYACVFFESSDRAIADFGSAILCLDGYGKSLQAYVLGNRTSGAGVVLSRVTLQRVFAA